jgi:ketosteroid isomerase-like protein
MWNSYDLNQVGALFLTDERVSYFSSEFEGAIWGFQRVLEHHEGFGFVPGGEEKGTRLWVEELTGTEFGATALLTGIWYFEGGGEEGEGPAAAPQRGPVTFVCVREEGGWRFAHMNFGNYPDAEEM